MQTSFGQFNETQSQDAFALQNSKLLKVRLQEVTIQAKLGSMVAYQGDVTFEHAGSGGLGRMLKKAVSGEGTQLMKIRGTGEVFLADQAQDVHILYLENDLITVNGRNLLAFDSGIDWDIKRVEGAGMVGGGLFNMGLHGTGWVAILSDGPPVLLDVGAAPTFADAQAAITWSSGVHDRAQDRLQDEEPDRPRLGRDAADGLHRPGLGARPAVRGPRQPDAAHQRQLARDRRRRPQTASEPESGH